MGIDQYFQLDTDTKLYMCCIESCQKTLKVGTTFNRKRHLELCHKNIYENIETAKKKIKKVPIAINKETYLKACVKLATINSMPFSLFDTEGFRDLTDPIQEAIGSKVNAHNIPITISDAANKIRELITNEVKHKCVCLKIDAATKFHRSILGIHLQYLSGETIKIRTLGIIELTKEHTAQTLTQQICKVLQDFYIQTDQIYSTTTDNGANILKVAQFMQPVAELESEKKNADAPNDIIYENEMYDIADHLLSTILSSARCAAHTFHLAVHDAITGSSQQQIQQVRDAVKKLRANPCRNEFSGSDKRKPFFDVVTRWNSCYDMIDCLVQEKDFIIDLFNDEISSSISEEVWRFMLEFRDAFKPIHIATKRLQEIDLSAGDFYKLWLECELELEGSSIPIAAHLLSCLKKRKKMLMDNSGNAFISAIYMDPRFNYLGSDFLSQEDKLRAKQHLMNTWRALEQINQDLASASASVTVSTSAIPEADTTAKPASRLESFLRSKTAHRINQNLNINSMERKIEALCQVTRLNSDENVFAYWHTKKNEDKALYILSQTVLAVPTSQVSVERTFNALALVLTQKRTQLTETNLKNVLIVKLNNDLLKEVSLTE